LDIITTFLIVFGATITLLILFLFVFLKTTSSLTDNLPILAARMIKDFLQELNLSPDLKSQIKKPAKRRSKSKYSYRKIRHGKEAEGLLLTPTETKFYHALKQAVGYKYDIHSMVRVADVIEPNESPYSKQRKYAFYKISQKHFDFVICDPETLAIEYAIELNDESHQQPDRQERDQFLIDACAEAGIKLIFFEPKPIHDLESIRRTLQQ